MAWSNVDLVEMSGPHDGETLTWSKDQTEAREGTSPYDGGSIQDPLVDSKVNQTRGAGRRCHVSPMHPFSPVYKNKN